MGFFSTILDKLGLSKAEAATPPAPATPVAPSAPAAAAPAATPAAPAAAVVNPIAMVDVVAQLEKRAAANPQKLNWRTSIVDLLKLLDMDSSLQARKELAKELYCPDELMGDSAKMNVWLHKNVLGHIAANGGNVPKELLD
jgi:nucleoid-associated protein YgaU